MRSLVLASSSPYRRSLLERLQLDFICASPNIDETPQPDESPRALAQRLSLEKAKALSKTHPNALIIGSDQVAAIESDNGVHLLGKPGDHTTATHQLQQSSGRNVHFYTGLCLFDSHTQEQQISCVPCTVEFRSLSNTDIEAYLQREIPYDCAGSFKCEGLGISLFKALHTSDPNSLIGLPLIELCRMLREAGLDPLHTTP